MEPIRRSAEGVKVGCFEGFEGFVEAKQCTHNCVEKQMSEKQKLEQKTIVVEKWHSYMNGSCHTFAKVMSHIWMCRVTYGNVGVHLLYCWEGSFVSVWHMYKWVMLRTLISHVTHMDVSCYICEWEGTPLVLLGKVFCECMSHVWMGHVTRVNKSCHAYECVMLHMGMRG